MPAKPARFTALFRAVLLAIAAACLHAAPAWAAPVKVQFSFIVVDDLTPRPVPFADFTLSSAGSTTPAATFRTDEAGKATADLEPGEYTLASVRPVTFKDRSIAWNRTISVRAEGENVFKLTDGDATVTRTPAQPEEGARRVSEEAKVYDRCAPSVAAVECDSGSGSAFLVDASGLFLTNQHVVDGTRNVAVKLRDGRKYEATIVEQDAAADVAVLLVNPAGLKGAQPLPFAKLVDGALAVTGEKVLAIGSPLHQQTVLTTGIVSKVEKDVLISDVNVNHGNSGGPLLNLAGEVLGITTFGDASAQGGPGISGIVSIEKARPVLDRAREKFASAKWPSADLLPVPVDVPIPVETLNKAAALDLKPLEISAPANFFGMVVTPFIAASEDAAIQRELLKYRNKRKRDRGEEGDRAEEPLTSHSYWEHYAIDDIEGGAPVVAIGMIPKLEETRGSKTAGIVGAILGAQVSRANYKFKDDFNDMELYRDGKLVQPVRRYRIPTSVYVDNSAAKAKDTAMCGVYMYDPMVFTPGAKLTLKVRKESNLEKWSELEINTRVLDTVWSDFETWRHAAVKAGALKMP